eukprot:9528819-Lingulodinium_polyedra.AAC.1
MTRQVAFASASDVLASHGRPGPPAAAAPQVCLQPGIFQPASHTPSVTNQALTKTAQWPTFSPRSAPAMPAGVQLLRALYTEG